jgi:NADPH-dependent curcumin reductase CurA
MVGGTVGRVVESLADGYAPGDLVVGYGGWQKYSILEPKSRQPVLKVPEPPPPSTALGVCGMPGVTGYFGLVKLGRPKSGETVVVSAASGAVGSAVGQIAKILGCRAVGVAGGPKKCAAVVDEYGFDACVDHRSPNMAAELAAACPSGIDVYFENVGGKVLKAVTKLLNRGARVPICGFISQYNEENPEIPVVVLGALPSPPEHRFFVVWEWPEEYPAAVQTMRDWVSAGKIRYREDFADGLEAAPHALVSVLRGENFGKKIVRL